MFHTTNDSSNQTNRTRVRRFIPRWSLWLCNGIMVAACLIDLFALNNNSGISEPISADVARRILSRLVINSSANFIVILMLADWMFELRGRKD